MHKTCAKLFSHNAASMSYSPLVGDTEARRTGAVVYQEAEPYQAELRQHARAFLGALQQAGFSLAGVLNGVPEEQYILGLTSETCGRVQPTAHFLCILAPQCACKDSMCSVWTDDMRAEPTLKTSQVKSCREGSLQRCLACHGAKTLIQ